MIPSTDIVLKLFIPLEHSTLRTFYRQRIDEHNNKVCNDMYADSGFDLGLPTDFSINKLCSNKIPLGIYCSMYCYTKTGVTSSGCNAAGSGASYSGDVLAIPQAYYLYPRSSIIKTSMRLSNSVGIIDRGYRGEITAVVDNIDHASSNPFNIHAFERYFQICHPSLNPFKVILVSTKEELGTTTERNGGGFGSTGR